MDLRNYYQKIRETEATIPGQYAVVVSCATPDGGKSGVLVEVTRAVAAQLTVEGSARLATETEAADFQKAQAAAQKAAQAAAAATKVAVTMVSSDDLKKLTDDVNKLKSGTTSTKE